ncbi:MAG: BsuPI-related putative proteinase inhibitor [Planctomycetota bacterium]
MSARANISKWVVISLIVVITCNEAFAGRIIFVDDDAAGAKDGSSWTDAYKYLQDALPDADFTDKPVEIRVAQGIYRPDRNTFEPNGTGDREATFPLISGVAIKGGYAGLGQADPNARDIEAYETILSGDLAGNDIDVNDPCDLLNEPTRSENSYHVVVVITILGTDPYATLDGLTITGGNASGDEFMSLGGGIFNSYWGRTTVTSCIITGNSAGLNGGGMFNCIGPISNCVISGNTAKKGGGLIFCDGHISDCIINGNLATKDGGGGLAKCDGAITDCIITGNSTAGNGGGLFECEGIIRNSTISENSAFQGGGLSHCRYVTDCTITENSANSGGGLSNCNSITNCTVSGNRAKDGGGVYDCLTIKNCTITGNKANGDGGGIYCNEADTKVTNCILRDNSDSADTQASGQIYDCLSYVSYSCIEGGWPGEGNIDSDPCFAYPGYWDANETPEDVNDDFWIDGDYHLKSQVGRWDTNSQSWVKDDVTSSCIDAGDPYSPINLEPFPNGGVINMGTYGGTAEASKSYFGEPLYETIIAGDINGDCRVDFKDFELLAFHWLEGVSTVNSNRIVMDGIEYYMQTDKSVYHQGENVQMLFRVTNLRNEAVRISCYQIPGFNFLVQKDNETVWMQVHMFYTGGYDVDITTGASKRVSYNWDMKDDNGNQVEPGEYNVIGVMYNGWWNYYNYGVNTSTEINIPISIIP